MSAICWLCCNETSCCLPALCIRHGIIMWLSDMENRTIQSLCCQSITPIQGRDFLTKLFPVCVKLLEWQQVTVICTAPM